MTNRTVLHLAAVGALLASANCGASENLADARTLALIAHDISELKATYPQLEEFSSKADLDLEALSISYAYRTHKAARSGGWTSGVPNPDEDGVWFYIDFHDPASTAQIHTQPASIGRQCLGKKHVSFLILEGPSTTSVNGAIWQILRKYGVADCPTSIEAQ